MSWRFMKDLAKSLELSSCAASRVGPKIFRPCSRKMLTMPCASGASGPTTVRPMFSRRANSASSWGSVMERFSRRGSSAVPPLPGATYTIWMRSDWASFQASACSRPPEPTTSIFMNVCRLFFDDGVGMDILDVVQVFQGVQQFLHARGVLAAQHGFGIRPHGDLRH